MERILSLLAKGEMEPHGLLPWSSNYTFLVTVRDAFLECLAVYKPQWGERPLWDFPRGTLCLREVAAYLVSEALGWPFIPPTVLRHGPPMEHFLPQGVPWSVMGRHRDLGMIQLFVEADPEAHYFTLREEEAHRPDFQRIALFDYVVNNADRRSGHCLKGPDGRILVLDHGLTFHVQPKLRTVIWEFAGQPIPDEMLRDLEAFRRRLSRSDPWMGVLWKLLSDEEIEALQRRLDGLLETRRFPRPGPGRHVPWPPI